MTDITKATIAGFATQTGLLPLRTLQLIGVAGPEDDRRALLRHASGQIETVHVGDKMRLGTVVAIHDDAVMLQSTSDTRSLRIPTNPEPRAAA